MNPIEYLTTADPLFGWVEWILFIAQIVLLLVGAYFAFLYRDSNAIKVAALKRFGYVTLVLGALGTLLGALKLTVLPPFDSRLWLALIVLFELAFAVYALIYSRTTYPEQVAAAAAAQRRPAAKGSAGAQGRRPSPASPNAAPKLVDVPMPTAGGRRDSRRDRKRKKR
ncbi:MAG: hypothetical protein H7Z42_13250 [Roseiflexaceae bacterium]|nr:hypothetical protein [Roseiflexaceae bacterium]